MFSPFGVLVKVVFSGFLQLASQSKIHMMDGLPAWYKITWTVERTIFTMLVKLQFQVLRTRWCLFQKIFDIVITRGFAPATPMLSLVVKRKYPHRWGTISRPSCLKSFVSEEEDEENEVFGQFSTIIMYLKFVTPKKYWMVPQGILMWPCLKLVCLPRIENSFKMLWPTPMRWCFDPLSCANPVNATVRGLWTPAYSFLVTFPEVQSSVTFFPIFLADLPYTLRVRGDPL